ncbi:MAG TPA: ABC transporter ATP-binding protein [Methanomassiliicoccales archaeon]|nr:ABC transporter ATP-binding protein [Methanomassiliicoccales archaeon]
MSYLDLKGLRMSYEGATKPCLDGIDLSIEKGEIVVILGPSGCGKTTTLKLIAGLLDPIEGDILLEGRSILTIPSEKRGVSMVFQKPLLFPHMTVAENIGFGLRMKGVPKELFERKVDEMLELVKLQGLRNRRATQLSGGQEQRVSLARALVIEPKLILLDEPLSALDAELRLEMRELILQIREKYNTTIVFVTHDQQEAVMLADKIALMIKGKIIQYDRATTFYTRPRTRRVAEFFGWTNFIPATQRGKTVVCPFGEFALEGLEEHNGPICLTIRPEAAVVSPKGEGYRAIVRSVMHMGTRIDYEVESMDTKLGISLHSNQEYAKGDEIFFKFVPSRIWAVKCDDKSVCDNRVVWENTSPLQLASDGTKLQD